MSGTDFNGSLVIHTQSGAIYRFGPTENDKGERAVSKDNGTLSFGRGILVGSGSTHVLGGQVDEGTPPMIGAQLVIKPTDIELPSNRQYWFSTQIVSIEQA